MSLGVAALRLGSPIASGRQASPSQELARLTRRHRPLGSPAPRRAAPRQLGFIRTLQPSAYGGRARYDTAAELDRLEGAALPRVAKSPVADGRRAGLTRSGSEIQRAFAQDDV